MAPPNKPTPPRQSALRGRALRQSPQQYGASNSSQGSSCKAKDTEPSTGQGRTETQTDSQGSATNWNIFSTRVPGSFKERKPRGEGAFPHQNTTEEFHQSMEGQGAPKKAKGPRRRRKKRWRTTRTIRGCQTKENKKEKERKDPTKKKEKEKEKERGGTRATLGRRGKHGGKA